MGRKKTTSEFIVDAILRHGDRYDYSKVEYINNKTKVIIICKEHREFHQRPNDHLHGKGCPDCGGSIKGTTEKFINDAKVIHGDRYNYSKVEYNGNKTKVVIICSKHGEFRQTPDNHLHGKGCPDCGGSIRGTTEKFIDDAILRHGDKYDYSKVEYINSRTKVIIICRSEEFHQRPNDHLHGSGCPDCGGTIRGTTEKFITDAKVIHGDRYDYSKVEYINSRTKVVIICSKHGEFRQTPHNHLSGRGCPFCKNKTEGKLKNFFLSIYPSLLTQGKFEWCKSLTTQHYYPFDFILEDYKIIIELDGRQHFQDVEGWYSKVDNVRSRDVYKIKCALANGYSIIHLYQEDVFDDKQDWENKLRSAIKYYENPEAIFIEGSVNYGFHKEQLDRDENLSFEDIDTDEADDGEDDGDDDTIIAPNNIREIIPVKINIIKPEIPDKNLLQLASYLRQLTL